MSLQEDAKRILPYVQAMAEGKTVEQRLFVRGNMASGGWFLKQHADGWSSEYEYRIKPEKKWRPYTRDEIERDVIRVRSKVDGRAYLVTLVAEIDVYVGGLGSFKFSEVLDSFTHLDGTPCGVEVEE